ncbi:MAG: protein translocase subunit SecD [Moorellales bacterium]
MSRRSFVVFLVVAALIVAAGAYLLRPLLGLIEYGLDLQGGVHVVAQARGREGKPVTDEDMRQLQMVIRQRVDELGVTEPLIQRQGADRLIVELAGVKDPDEAVRLIGKTAMLEFKTYDGKVVVTGAELKDARPGRHPYTNEPIVELEFNAEGARKFGEVTQELVQQYGENDPRRRIAIYLDQELLTNPFVRSAITTGKADIEGGFASFDEAAELAALLRGGALPVNVDILEKRLVGPTLGQDSLARSRVAVTVAVVGVLIFMLLVYRLPGVVADLSLVVYGLLLLAALAGIGAVLTLPGIAGILLSLGMAVDANIIIYERIKDELRSGKTLRAAVEAGFRRAFWTIFDANLTTILAAAVLYFLGTGPIRGFAVTLVLGIAASFFTAVVLTRWMLRLLVRVEFLRRPALYGVAARTAAVGGSKG